MATSDKPRPASETPVDLLPVIRKSGVLNDRQLEEVKVKVLAGDYPFAAKDLAERLIEEKILTDYQARRFLQNKPHGLVVGRYVILDRVGSGSMGRVYKASHRLMGRTVALKIIAPEIVTNGRVVARFQREMKMVGRLDHPNVVRAFDADQVGQVLFIVMEFVAGQSLGQKFRSTGPMPPLEVADYGAMASLGLAHAHSQGIVHRDIKPSNLLLNGEGVVKVLDLGLGVLLEADQDSAFATADGIAVGTIDYMSPEQAMGKEVDGRSDIFSLGCAMYHMISGKVPFPGDAPVERLGKRISGKPVPILDVRPDVPPRLVEVMERLLANKVQDRYQSATEAAEALQSVRQRKAPPKPKSAEIPPPVVAPEPPPPQYIEVRPDYPGWFAPLAELAERSSIGALSIIVLLMLASGGAGFLMAVLMR